MKERLLNNWHLLRFLRLLAGIAIAAQALYLKEWMLFIAGIAFAALALFHTGCCASGVACNSNHNNSTDKNEKEIEYEEVV